MVISEALSEAFRLISIGDSDLLEILSLSMSVSAIALLISVALGLPMGTLLAIQRFPGRKVVITLINSLMGMPPVVIGLLAYLLLSRSGPLGVLGLLYTPSAMVIVQVLLITPIIAALSFQVMDDLHKEYRELFLSLNVGVAKAIPAYVWDARYSLLTTVLAGFGRAISEVGAVMIVGGNIDHLTRVMTTAIALETSRGELAIALALGIVLLTISIIVNGTVTFVKSFAQKNAFS
jgi:tungstate transport system permease protein